MIKRPQKKNLSSIQVLKTLQVLLQGDYNMQELIKILNENESGRPFNNSVISKYINTCRYCGIDIPKIQNRYYVSSMPFGLKLDDTETELLSKLHSLVENTMTKRSFKSIDNFVDKLNRYSDKKIAKIEKSSYDFSSEIFENAISRRKRVILMFKNRQELNCTPIKIVDTEDKKFFKVYDKRERMIDVSRLSGIRATNESFLPAFYPEQTVIFKLKGNLAKRYEARYNETVNLNPLDESITVSNLDENKDDLISRLLRYDDKCEVLHPKALRGEMKQIIQNTLNNYGVE